MYGSDVEIKMGGVMRGGCEVDGMGEVMRDGCEVDRMPRGSNEGWL